MHQKQQQGTEIPDGLLDRIIEEPQINPLADFVQPGMDDDTMALVLPAIVVLAVCLILWMCGLI